MDVGSGQLTGELLLPKGTVTVISSGKVVTVGGVESAAKKKKTRKVKRSVPETVPLYWSIDFASHFGSTIKQISKLA